MSLRDEGAVKRTAADGIHCWKQPRMESFPEEKLRRRDDGGLVVRMEDKDRSDRQGSRGRRRFRS